MSRIAVWKASHPEASPLMGEAGGVGLRDPLGVGGESTLSGEHNQ